MKVSDPMAPDNGYSTCTRRERGCFVPGTHVHTKGGFVPIEKIMVGDLVLSRPEGGGALAYKRVISTAARPDKQAWIVTYLVGDDDAPQYLVCTGDHPFWVEGGSWTRADLLNNGTPLRTADGEAYGMSARRLFETEIPGIAWSSEEGIDSGPTIDMRAGTLEFMADTFAPAKVVGYLSTVVHSLDVEEFHTYFVGEVGIWVHALSCQD